MRLIFTFIIILTSSVCLLSQTETIDEIVNKGVTLFEEGKYEEAISEYEKALKLDSKSLLANYELAYAYFALGDYEKALKYTDILLKEKSNFKNLAYVIRGSCYDELKKPKKAIKNYKAGIEDFPEDHLLRYNLALTYYREGAHKDAESELMQSITLKPSHGSSHLLLAELNKTAAKRVPSLLSLYFFLLLEPDTQRGKDALKMLEEQISYGVTKKDEKNIEVNIGMPDPGDEFSAVNMLLSLTAANNLGEENAGKTQGELFVETTRSFFSILQETSEGKTGLYWEFYEDLYSQILDSGHLESFCYYISQSNEEATKKWFDENVDKIDDFIKWINN